MWRTTAQCFVSVNKQFSNRRRVSGTEAISLSNNRSRNVMEMSWMHEKRRHVVGNCTPRQRGLLVGYIGLGLRLWLRLSLDRHLCDGVRHQTQQPCLALCDRHLNKNSSVSDVVYRSDYLHVVGCCVSSYVLWISRSFMLWSRAVDLHCCLWLACVHFFVVAYVVVSSVYEVHIQGISFAFRHVVNM